MQLAVATNAALSPEFYWKSVLPTTPMPKAITDLLDPGQYNSLTKQNNEEYFTTILINSIFFRLWTSTLSLF